MRRLLAGFQVARDDRVVGRCLVIIYRFSLLSLPFIGQMPVLADRNLGIAAKSTQYGLLYACFGVGALPRRALDRHGPRRPQPRARASASAWSPSPCSWPSSRSCGRPALAYPVDPPGRAWPTSPSITSLSTVLQQRLDDSNRGRVMALWIMGFGGTVPIGNLIAGPLIEATSITDRRPGRRRHRDRPRRLRRPRSRAPRRPPATPPSPPPTDPRPATATSPPESASAPCRSRDRASARRQIPVSLRGGCRPGARGRRRGCP